MNTTTALTVELRKVKHSPSLSQETEAFTADVYVNGKREGTAENHGQGGPTNIHPNALREKLDAYGASLPPLTVPSFESAVSVKQDAETLVDDALSVVLQAKETARITKLFEKDFATRIMWVDREGDLRQTAKLEPARMIAALADRAFLAKRDAQGDCILNALPKDEAKALWWKAVVR